MYGSKHRLLGSTRVQASVFHTKWEGKHRFASFYSNFGLSRVKTSNIPDFWGRSGLLTPTCGKSVPDLFRDFWGLLHLCLRSTSDTVAGDHKFLNALPNGEQITKRVMRACLRLPVFLAPKYTSHLFHGRPAPKYKQCC